VIPKNRRFSWVSGLEEEKVPPEAARAGVARLATRAALAEAARVAAAQVAVAQAANAEAVADQPVVVPAAARSNPLE